MDLLIAVSVFSVLVLAPILWRLRHGKKKRLIEKVAVVLFLAWLLFAIRAFL